MSTLLRSYDTGLLIDCEVFSNNRDPSGNLKNPDFFEGFCGIMAGETTVDLVNFFFVKNDKEGVRIEPDSCVVSGVLRI